MPPSRLLPAFLFISAALPAAAQVPMGETSDHIRIYAMEWEGAALTTSSATLSWHTYLVVTDYYRGYTGPAESNELRFSEQASEDFELRVSVDAAVPVPGPAGESRSVTVAGLEAGRSYYFVIRTRYLDGYVDSDPMRVTTPPDPDAPQAIVDLVVDSATGGEVKLRWTAPADDTPAESVRRYEVCYSTAGPVTTGLDFDAATDVTYAYPPKTPGSPETFTVTGLVPGATFHFSVRSIDEGRNASAPSNDASLFLAESPSGASSGGAPSPCGGATAGDWLLLPVVLLAASGCRRGS